MPSFMVGTPVFPADPFWASPSWTLFSVASLWGAGRFKGPLGLILDGWLFHLFGCAGFHRFQAHGGRAGFAGIQQSRCSEPGEGRRIGRGVRVQASTHLHPVAPGTQCQGRCPSSWRCPHIAPVGLALAPCPFTLNLLSLPSVSGQMGMRERRSREAALCPGRLCGGSC